MHARVPADLKAPIEREVRRLRMVSALKLFVPVVAILTAIVALGILWKGHALLYLLDQLFGDRVSQSQFVTYLLWTLLVCAVIGTFFLFRHLVTKELFEDYLYCKRCDAYDFDEVGACSVCQQPLSHKESFFYIEFEDERKIIEAFGCARRGEHPRRCQQPMRRKKGASPASGRRGSSVTIASAWKRGIPGQHF